MIPSIWENAGVGLGSNLDGLKDHTVLFKDGSIKQVQDFVLYDTARVIIGTTLAAGVQFNFFSVPQGAQGATWNTAAAFRKTYTDTNLWGQGGLLPKGNFMEIRSIQFQINVAAALDTTPLGSAATINGTRSTDASAENQLLAYQQTIYWRFKMDNREYERGLAIHAPSSFYQAGFGYSGATTVEGGTFANGTQGRQLNQFHYLNEMQPFVVEALPQATITNVQQVLVQCCLVGRLYTPVG